MARSPTPSRRSDMQPSTVDFVTAAGLDPAYVDLLVTVALAEDLAGGVDVTSEATIPAGDEATAELVARAPGVLAGLPLAAAAFDLVGAGTVHFAPSTKDGERVARGDVLATVTGPTRALLTAERTALNLLCHASGVATATRAWVDALAGTQAMVRDTRKTTPGLRLLEKYAVRCGGGVNHRMSLADAVLVKDNHVAAAGGVRAAFDAVREAHPELTIEVEVDTVEQAIEVIDAGAQLVLLDNMPPAQMRDVVAYASERGGVELEASGGLTLDRAREVAETGVDYLAVGALTHSAPALDIGLDIEEAPR